jgi:site-specific recombinase XerD
MSKNLKSVIEYQLQNDSSTGLMQSRTWYLKAADISQQSISAALLFQLDKNLDKKFVLYKPAKIYNAGGNLASTWFVHFSHRNSTNEKFKRVKLTGDINRLPDADKRIQAAKILQRLINDALANGWAPGNLNETMSNTINYTVVGSLTEQLNIKIKSLSKATEISYKSRVNMFLQWLTDNNLHNISVKDFTTIHADKYTSYLLDKGNNNKTVNGTNETLRSLFTRLTKLKIITENPYTGIDRLKVTDSNWFEPYTADELVKIASTLKTKMPELYCFWAIIYYTFMRPLSIMHFTADNFDFNARLIYVQGKQHKNKKAAVKQMVEPLYNILVAHGYDAIKQGIYFFSTGLKPGRVLQSPKRASEAWKHLIIDGEGINKKLYAAKHTGGSNYLEDNAGAIDLNWLQKQMGHSSLSETETYVKKRTVQKLDESKTKLRRL